MLGVLFRTGGAAHGRCGEAAELRAGPAAAPRRGAEVILVLLAGCRVSREAAELRGQCWADADGDGYGYELLVDGVLDWPEAVECLPEGTVDRGGDCDDANPEIHVGVNEVCDDADVDEDCDGKADDRDGSTDYQYEERYDPDRDGDGWGETDGYDRGDCDRAPAGYGPPGDCDDGDATIHPEASETCGDGVDSNCGGADCAEVELDTEADLIYLPNDDAYYTMITRTGDCDGDGVLDVLIGGQSAEYFGAELGAARLITGAATGQVDESAAWANFHDMQSATGFGKFVASIGDLNADGLADVAVGASLSENVYVFASPFSGDILSEAAIGVLTPEARGATLSMGDAGDLDGDGVHELVLSGLREGGDMDAYIVPATAVGTVRGPDVALATFVGSGSFKGFSGLSEVGDLDGDGVTDVLLGVPQGTSGVVRGFTGPFSGSISADAAAFEYSSDANWMGWYFDLGDVDGDGNSDVAMSGEGFGGGWDVGVCVAYGPAFAPARVEDLSDCVGMEDPDESWGEELRLIPESAGGPALILAAGLRPDAFSNEEYQIRGVRGPIRGNASFTMPDFEASSATRGATETWRDGSGAILITGYAGGAFVIENAAALFGDG